MPPESTTEYNMENWREATKNWTFTPYFIVGYRELLGTIYVGNASEKSYERADFEHDLRKVCRPVKNKK
jgi:hypothetical protein